MSFAFESPGWLICLVLVPVGIYVRHIWKGRGGRIDFSFAIWGGERFVYPGFGLKTVLFVTHAAFWAGCIFFIVALAGPARTERERVYLSKGMDIMIVLDESPSMSARDFQPENRFEAAKEVIRRFVRERDNDAIGLVSFSEEAALRVPLTLDRETLLERLDGLSIMSLGDGTAIGMGLAVAALHLKEGDGTEKIVVLITDGENNAGEIFPGSAAEIARKLAIRIYSIGMGTQGEVPIEYTDPETGVVRKGIFESRFNEELLREIAESSGGRYFPAKSPGALNAVFRTIHTQETTEKRVRFRVHTIPLYRSFVLIGLGLILFDFLIRKFFLKEIVP